MPSRRVSFQAGNFYHVYNRGNNRQNIFFKRDNYLHFLHLIREHLVNNRVDILAYCLMPNHYHLLVYLQDDNLSAAMHRLSVAYTKGINKRFVGVASLKENRSGSLFEGRFQSIHVNDTNYLIHLCRYIHLNPVKAGFVDRAEEWEFSSYAEYAGLRSGTLPNMEYLRLQFQSELEEFSIDDNLQRLFLDW
jgi:putative transposase